MPHAYKITVNEFLENLKITGTDQDKVGAITTIDGPSLIIAGPGSGKTRTLVERVVFLILNGTPAENIFVATFTEKAAKELITRVSNRLIDLDIVPFIHLREFIKNYGKRT